MPDTRQMLIDDFSGGMRRGEFGKWASNQCVDSQNAFVDAGTLVPAKDWARLAASTMKCNSGDVGVIQNHVLYYDIVGSKWVILARSGKVVWIGVPDSATWSTSSTITWYPILGSAYQRIGTDSANQETLLHRDNVGAESFVQGATYLHPAFTGTAYRSVYMFPEDPGANDKLIRFNGFYYKTATVKVDKATYDAGGWVKVISSNGSLDWTTTGIESGDILYLKDDSTSTWHTAATSSTGGYVVKEVAAGYLTLWVKYNGASGADVWETTGKGAAGIDYVTYIIVRVANAGVDAGTSCSVSTSGSHSWAAGSYEWAWRYSNHFTGMTGNPSSACTAQVNPSTDIVVSGWDVDNPDMALDAVQILRRKDGGNWEWVASVQRSIPSDFAASYTDAGATAIMTCSDEIFLHDRPSGTNMMRGLWRWKDRLWTSGTGQYAGMLRCSSLNSKYHNSMTNGDLTDQGWEYWPTYQYPVYTSDLVVTAGGYFFLQDGDSVVTMAGSDGTFSDTGVAGETSFVFASNAIYRLSGSGWDTFAIAPFARVPGPLSTRNLASGLGSIAWVSADNIYMMGYSGDNLRAVSKSLFPYGLLRDPAALTVAKLKLWRLCFMRDKLLVAAMASSAATTTDSVYALDMGNGGWTRLNIAAWDMLPWQDGQIGGSIVAGTACASATRTVTGVVYSDIYAMFESAATDVYWLSPPLIMAADANELDNAKQIKTVTCYWRPTSADKVAKLTVYDDLSSTAKYDSNGASENQTITKYANSGYSDGQRTRTRWQVNADCVTARLKIEWNGECNLEWVVVEYEVRSSDWNSVGA